MWKLTVKSNLKLSLLQTKIERENVLLVSPLTISVLNNVLRPIVENRKGV